MITWNEIRSISIVSSDLMQTGKYGKFGMTMMQLSNVGYINWDIWHNSKGLIASGKLMGNDFNLCRKIVENVCSELYQVIVD